MDLSVKGVLSCYFDEWKEHPLVVVGASQFDESIFSVNGNLELGQIYRSYLALAFITEN